MGGGGSPDGVLAKVTVVDVNGDVVTLTVEGDKAKYFEVGETYEAAFRPKQPKKP